MNLNFDINKLKRLLSPRSYQDLDTFMEALPQRAGQNTLIAAGIAWAAAGLLIVLALSKFSEAQNLRDKLLEVQATVPPIPVVNTSRVSNENINEVAAGLQSIYADYDIRVSARGSNLLIESTKTHTYGAFREAIIHSMAMNKDWQVNLEKFCVGRECDRGMFNGEFQFNHFSIEKSKQTNES